MKTQAEKAVPLKNAERRKYQRVQKKATLAAGRLTYPVDNENFCQGASQNISLGGILMNTGERFAKGDLLQVKITLPGWQKHHPGFIKVMENSIGAPFSAICEVLRVKEGNDQFEIAARFVNIDPDDFVALQRYVEKESLN